MGKGRRPGELTLRGRLFPQPKISKCVRLVGSAASQDGHPQYVQVCTISVDKFCS